MGSIIIGQTVVFPSAYKRTDLVPGIFISVSNRMERMSWTTLFKDISALV